MANFRPDRHLSVMRDVTRRKQMGRSLLEQGIVDWIPKPFSVHDLADKIAEVLQGKA